MLRRKIRLGKKGMDWAILIGIVIALFAALIVIILFTTKIGQVKGVNDDCTNAGGSCVERGKCAACSSIGDCKVGFNRCAEEEGKDIVCCPNGDVI